MSLPMSAKEYDKFWAQVAVTPSCWLWTGASRTGGRSKPHHAPSTGRYGAFVVSGRRLGAHRVAYWNVVGPVGDGLHLDHLCKNTLCVNPEHLEPVTPAEHALRGSKANQTHCKHGHEYTPENTLSTKWSKRKCKICQYAAEKRYRTRVKAAAA